MGGTIMNVLGDVKEGKKQGEYFPNLKRNIEV